MPIRTNERSWAIDVITHINGIAANSQRAIQRAGGEQTLTAGAKRFHPDVLLFGDGSTLLQGWELKMPDTPITNAEFIANAEAKARGLGLNSFLLWNVSTAVLYVEENGEFLPRRQWAQLAHITRRADVETHRADWIAALETIVRELNEFFERGELRARPLADALSDSSFADFVLQNTGALAGHLQAHARRNADFGAEMTLWWRTVKSEHAGENQWEFLARTLLLGWINKLLFAHVLKATRRDAAIVERINDATTLPEATAIFAEITSRCDFWSIFAPRSGETAVSPQAWSQLVGINGFLTALQFEKIGQPTLQIVLQSTANAARRKIAGQYATPPTLANLLIRLVMENSEDFFFDPFCGTGTIARAALDLKKQNGRPVADAAREVWASDKFSYPLQIAALALSEPLNRGRLLPIFQADAFALQPQQKIDFQNPDNSERITESLPVFPCIAANLPFVPFEEREALNPLSADASALVASAFSGAELPARADLYAFIPFALWPMLAENGNLGIIISNSWLGTDWGAAFRKLLGYFYFVETVVTSGKGRWFDNAQVVTNLLLLRKRTQISAPQNEETTSFVTVQRALEDLQGEVLNETASAIRLRDSSAGDIAVQTVTCAQARQWGNLGLQPSAFFSDLGWLEQAQDKLVPASQIFEINRGERRGWDALFYPPQDSGIEAEYIRPVLKSSREIHNLIADAHGLAFCCARSITELESLGHEGALRWIRRFEFAVNGNGKPLPQVLQRTGMQWYQMPDAALADLVTTLNPERRIFIAKMRARSFVNQRLIRFSLRDVALDLDLQHALLNSCIGVFFIEALGFGRGLGALDLSATKLSRHLHILKSDLLSQQQAKKSKLYSRRLWNVRLPARRRKWQAPTGKRSIMPC